MNENSDLTDQQCPLGIADLGDGLGPCLLVGCHNRSYCHEQTEAQPLPYLYYSEPGKKRLVVYTHQNLAWTEEQYFEGAAGDCDRYGWEDDGWEDYDFLSDRFSDTAAMYEFQEIERYFHRWIPIVEAYGWIEAKELPYRWEGNSLVVFKEDWEIGFQPAVSVNSPWRINLCEHWFVWASGGSEYIGGDIKS